MPPLDEPQSDEATQARAAPIVAWLLDEERVHPARTPFLLDRYVRRLVQAGLPLARVSLHIPQLHPQITARSLIWDAEAGGAVEAGHEHSARDERGYIASPVKPIFEGKPAIRRRIETLDCPRDFPILVDLAERGFTDYGIRPLTFSGGSPNAISIATRRPGGFAEDDFVVLDATLPAFAAVLELQQLRRTARELLGTYVGRNTGERIFSGTIRRGDGEVMHAVLWYCDLRGFTKLSESRPLAKIIALLNAYFDEAARPVAEHGGEILKFIGDAMLAIFPCTPEPAALRGAADSAVAAAEAVVANVAAMSERCRADGGTDIACGVAVHVGEVMYGNIGAGDRLDFTVIGRAVNLVTRIEPLCAELGEPVLVSSAIAQVADRAFRSRGRHRFKGIAEAQEVFAPA